MKHRRNLIIGAVLSAVTAVIALQTVSAPQQDLPLTPPTDPPAAAAEVSPTDTPTFQGCAYSWAYRDAPDLTRILDTKIKETNPAASATATQFGEDCLKADGSVTFGVMQTDFSVHLPVDDLTNKEEFGNLVAQVIQLVLEIPREQIPGPNYGFVEFWFEKNETERIAFRVPIQEYLATAQGKSGAELFQMFYAPPP